MSKRPAVTAVVRVLGGLAPTTGGQAAVLWRAKLCNQYSK